MDHLNITIHNGAMVSTKRGLQVSKTKHHGIRFINTYAPEASADAKPGKSPTKSVTPAECRGSMEHCFKLSRRAKIKRAPSDKSTSPDGTSSDDSTIGTAFSWDGQHTKRQTLSPDTYRFDVWDTHQFGCPMTARNRKMVHVYFSSIPAKMYPLDNILTHNPARTPSFLERINRDDTIMRCAAGTGLLLDSLQKGRRCSDEMLEYMAQFYAMINFQLQDRGQGISKATIECVCSLAIGAVSFIVSRSCMIRGLTGNALQTHIGQYDHWRLHMKGLRQITDLETASLRDGGYLMNKMRR